jgi:amidase
MRVEEYRKLDAISLAGLIAKGEVSAEEVLEAAVARAEQINPAINAIVHKQYEQARKAVAAGLPEGPLKGVPYLVKDLGFFETGELVSRRPLAAGCSRILSPITRLPM